MTSSARTPAALWARYSAWVFDAPRQLVSFSLARIIFALAMLLELLPSLSDRQIIWGMGAWWMEPESSRRGWWGPLRMLFSQSNPLLFDLAFFALLALVVLFLVGWQSRFVTPVLLVFWVALFSGTTVVTNGGDTLTRIALLFFVFARISDHFSVDAWITKRRGRQTRRLLPQWLGNALHNTVLMLCLFQILLVYSVSSILKLQGSEWPNGTALYYALSLEQFQLFPTVNALIWESTPVIFIATWVALLVQLLFPVMLLHRLTRYIAVILLTGMHLGIGVFLGLWPFSLAMIALDMLFISDRSWHRLAERVRGVLGRITVLRGLTDASVPSHADSQHEAQQQTLSTI